MKKIMFILTLFISTSGFFITAVNAEMYSFAKTTPGKLNVRATPDGKNVIKQLSHGSVVAILQQEGAWSYVLYLESDDPANTKYGWVSSQYLRVLYSKDMDASAESNMAGI